MVILYSKSKDFDNDMKVIMQRQTPDGIRCRCGGFIKIPYGPSALAEHSEHLPELFGYGGPRRDALGSHRRRRGGDGNA